MKKVSIHEGHRARLKNKLLHGGASSLADHELLELLLFYSIPQKNTNPLAHTLLRTFGSLKNVLLADPADLQQISGIGQHSASLLALIPEISRRIYQPQQPVRLRNVQDASRYVVHELYGKKNETLYLLCLDIQFRLLDISPITEGTLDAVSIHLRPLVSAALRHNAAFIILAHNHPTGSPRPSRPDIVATQEILSVLKPLGIKLIDHIIVSGTEYYSFFRQEIFSAEQDYPELAAAQYAVTE